MALFDLAMMTVSSSGTGTISLNAAVSGFLTFDLAGCSTAATGQSVSYGINDTTQSEAATGTYYSSSVQLARGSSTVDLISTNGNSPINMSNSAQVYITPIVRDFIPAGTKMLFVQTSAPTGWTKDVDQNDKALRIVSGAASTGGTLAFSTVFGYTATGGFTIGQANLPNVNFVVSGNFADHLHGGGSATNKAGQANGFNASGGGGNIWYGPAIDTNGVSGGATTISGAAASGGSGTSLTAPIDMRVAYVDVIKCTKS